MSEMPFEVVFAIVILVVIVAACSPLALIWALNTLIPTLAIPITVKTYSAAAVICALVTAR